MFPGFPFRFTPRYFLSAPAGAVYPGGHEVRREKDTVSSSPELGILFLIDKIFDQLDEMVSEVVLVVLWEAFGAVWVDEEDFVF